MRCSRWASRRARAWLLRQPRGAAHVSVRGQRGASPPRNSLVFSFLDPYRRGVVPVFTLTDCTQRLLGVSVRHCALFLVPHLLCVNRPQVYDAIVIDFGSLALNETRARHFVLTNLNPVPMVRRAKQLPFTNYNPVLMVRHLAWQIAFS
jgi:hypothetical protein